MYDKIFITKIIFIFSIIHINAGITNTIFSNEASIVGETLVIIIYYFKHVYQLNAQLFEQICDIYRQ